MGLLEGASKIQRAVETFEERSKLWREKYEQFVDDISDMDFHEAESIFNEKMKDIAAREVTEQADAVTLKTLTKQGED